MGVYGYIKHMDYGTFYGLISVPAIVNKFGQSNRRCITLLSMKIGWPVLVIKMSLWIGCDNVHMLYIEQNLWRCMS